MSEIFKVRRIVLKLVVSLLILGTATLGLGQMFVIHAHATTQETFSNPEAVLFMQFEPNTKTKTIVSELPNNSDYGVVFFNNYIEINNHPFPVSVNGQILKTSIQKEVTTEVDTLIDGIEHVKSIGVDDLKMLNGLILDKDAKAMLQASISKFSTADMLLKYDSAKSQTIALVGSEKELSYIRSKFENQIKNATDTDYVENAYFYTSQQLKELQNEVTKKIKDLENGGLSTQEAIASAFQSELEEYLTEEQRSLVVNLPQTTIDKVNEIIKTDIAGNLFALGDDLVSLNLTEEENKVVIYLISQFNNRPETVRNDIQQILKSINRNIMPTFTLHSGCIGSYYEWFPWWGRAELMSKCRANRIAYEMSTAISFGSGATEILCAAIGLFLSAVGGLGCVAAVIIYSRYLNYIAGRLSYFASICDFVRFNITYWGWMWVRRPNSCR
ncbi:MAG: hypothetical protein AAGF07_02570 [Patescibacteria group bacterium]